jgi:hypothetical protein
MTPACVLARKPHALIAFALMTGTTPSAVERGIDKGY